MITVQSPWFIQVVWHKLEQLIHWIVIQHVIIGIEPIGVVVTLKLGKMPSTNIKRYSPQQEFLLWWVSLDVCWWHLLMSSAKNNTCSHFHHEFSNILIHIHDGSKLLFKFLICGRIECSDQLNKIYIFWINCGRLIQSVQLHIMSVGVAC